MKDFTYIYYFEENEDIKVRRKWRKFVDLDMNSCYAIYLSMRPWLNDRLIDMPKRLTGIFWLLRKDNEKLILREVKGGFLSKKLEDMEIKDAEDLEREMVKRSGTEFALLYEREGKTAKFVDFADEHLVQCYFHRSISSEVEVVFQHFAEKVGGSNEAEANQMGDFLKQRMKAGMKLPELVDIFEEMIKIPLHCSDELLRIETGVFDFSGDDRFYFDLTRQIPTGHDDEYYQIQLSIMFPVTEIIDNVCEDLDSDCRESVESFFAEIREMEVYQQLCKNDIEIEKVEVVVEET